MPKTSDQLRVLYSLPFVGLLTLLLHLFGPLFQRLSTASTPFSTPPLGPVSVAYFWLGNAHNLQFLATAPHHTTP